MKRTVDRYFFVWALLAPVTSVLILPTVQGTVPAFMMCFLSLFVVIVAGGDERPRYFGLLCVCVLIWLLFFSLSQFADLLVNYVVSFHDVVLNRVTDHSFVMRSSLFTQSLYLAAVMLFGVFVYVYYDERWDRVLIAGGVLMALFGLYEFVFFSIVGHTGDFLTNRGFGTALGKEAVAQLDSQRIVLAGHTFERLRSLTGEPSMYAFSIFPYWIYARSASRSRWPSLLIGISLILTASTTAAVGLICALAVRALRMRVDVLKCLLAVLALLVFAYLFRHTLLAFYQHGILDKIEGKNASGHERFGYFLGSVKFWLSLPLLNQFVGIGFGYVRSTDMASTLLVNNGILGVLLFTFIFLYPVFRLDWSEKSMALRQCLVSVYVMMMVSVPEFSYLAPWAFVALAYHRLNQSARAASPYAADPAGAGAALPLTRGYGS